MLPEREEILKTSANAESFNLFDLKLKAGYHPQYARNTLQLNRGGGRFSEIGYLAGVSRHRLELGAAVRRPRQRRRKDLFITNGIYRRPNDLDYINYVGNEAVQALASRCRIGSRSRTWPARAHAAGAAGELRVPQQRRSHLHQHGRGVGAGAAGLLERRRVRGPEQQRRARSRGEQRQRAGADLPQPRRERNGHHYLAVALRGAGQNTGGHRREGHRHARRRAAAARADADARLPVVRRSPPALRARDRRRASTR